MSLTANTLRLPVQARSLRPQAIATAGKNAALLSEQGYKCEFCTIFDQAFTITKPATANAKATQYKGWLPGGITQFPEGKCECEGWKREGVCKHVYYAIECKQEENRLAQMEAEQDERNAYAEAVAASVGAGRWDYLGPATPWERDAILDTIDGHAFIVEAAPIVPIKRAAEFHARHQAEVEAAQAQEAEAEDLPAGWPVCLTCGRAHASQMHDDDIPETSCDYCEKRFWCR